jgi:hypothetical protein
LASNNLHKIHVKFLALSSSEEISQDIPRTFKESKQQISAKQISDYKFN